MPRESHAFHKFLFHFAPLCSNSGTLVLAACSCRRQEETGKSTVGSRGRGPEAVRSRAFHDTAGASGPVGRVSGVSSAGAAARYRRGIDRRAGTLRVAEHSTHQHGEERYVRSGGR